MGDFRLYTVQAGGLRKCGSAKTHKFSTLQDAENHVAWAKTLRTNNRGNLVPQDREMANNQIAVQQYTGYQTATIVALINKEK